jgi:hypothetical protein
MVEVGELKIEHVLLFGIVAFLLYHLMGKCGCSGNGFSVGGYKPHTGRTNVGYSLYCNGAWGGSAICPGFNVTEGGYNRFEGANAKKDATNASKSFACIDSKSWMKNDSCVYTAPTPTPPGPPPTPPGPPPTPPGPPPTQLCDCSTTFIDSEKTTHTDQCTDGAISGTGRLKTFCTDQSDPEKCKTAGGRSWVSLGTCKWNGPPTPPTPPGPPPTPPPGPIVRCNPNIKPPQICPGGTPCPKSGKCNPPPPPPVDQRIIRCNPNIKPPQICPGGRPCPQNGKCVLPILCKPGATEACPGFPWTCPPNGMCPGKARPNTGIN